MSESTWDDPRITAYVLGELSADEQATFESQLESDSVLAAAVEEARGVTGQLKELYASESTPPLDNERRIAIVSGKATRVTSPSQSPASWRVPALVLAAAAVLLLLVGLSPWLREQETMVAQDKLLPAEQLVKEAQAASQPQLSTLNDLTVEESAAIELSEEIMEVDVAADELARVAEPRGAGNDPQPAAENAVSSRSLRSLAGGRKEDSVPQRAPAARGRGTLSQSRAAVQGGDESAEDVEPKQQPLRQLARGGEAGGGAAPKSSAMKRAFAPSAAPAPSAPTNANRRRGDLNRKAGGAADKAQNKQPAAAPIGLALTPLSPAASENLASGRAVKELEGELKELEAAVAPARPMPAIVDREQSSKDLQEVQGQVARVKKAADGGLGGGGFGGRGVGKRIAEAELNKNVPVDAERLRAALPEDAVPEGQGPGNSGDQFDPITDNPFKRVDEAEFSTFSIDVDTASYSKTRDFLMRALRLPSPDAVRIEEFINYFDYDYKAPKADAEHPFATHVEVTTCPWNTQHKLARIGLKGKTMTDGQRPPCNLVFLLDVSGSMDQPNKLPLVIEGMKMLTDRLRKKDRVAIVVYAGSEGLVLDSTSAKNKQDIKAALTRLRAGGSTNGGAGIALAYRTARDNFIADGVNRVILCTDGDFNVGVTNKADLVRMVEKESKGGIFISVLGFGMGNHNDAMLEMISGRGNGNYAFIDTQNEARKVLVDQTNGTLVTIAKDVKIQIKFNIKHVSQYRLIGYENRMLAKEDFKNDKIDAGEIGAGHAVTALYELVPAGLEADAAPPKVDQPRYQTNRRLTAAADSDELMILNLRYKQPDSETGIEVNTIVENQCVDFDKASDDVRFAAAVAGFGMKLRRSRYAGTWTWTEVQQVAKSATGEDDYELRAEFVELVRKASQLMGEE